MREVKFRAWDKQYNFMIPPEDIHPRVMNELITGEGKVLEIDERHSYLGTDINYLDISNDRILMQYTGLKDKNGKEICEGDIVRVYGGEYFQGYYEFDGIYKVVYREDLAGFCLKDKKDRFTPIADEIAYGPGNIEVYGNIYENPELVNP